MVKFFLQQSNELHVFQASTEESLGSKEWPTVQSCNNSSPNPSPTQKMKMHYENGQLYVNKSWIMSE